MDLRDYARILRSRWRSIVALTLIGLLSALAVSLTTTPTYKSSTQLFVTTGGSGDNVSNAYTGSLFSQLRVKSYSDIITSPLVTGPVIKRLGLPLSDSALAAEISASAPLDTVLIDVDVTDRDPAQAMRIANAVSQQFTKVIAVLETTGRNSSSSSSSSSSSAPSPVKLTVVKKASAAVQVAPRTKLNVALGLLVGLALGLGLAVVREQLDARVQGVKGLAEEFNVATLAVISFDPDTPKYPLTVQIKSTSPRAEAFRQLRTNLQFVNVDSPPTSLVVTSALPSDGKSTTACNLAIALAESGRKVLLVEGDLRRPKLGDYLGLEGAVGLSDVLVGRVRLEDAIQEWGVTGNMAVLPSGPPPPNPAELLGSQHMADLVTRMTGEGWFLVLDAPPLLPVTDAAVLAKACDGAVIVIKAGRTRVDELRQALGNLDSVGAQIFGVIINMAPVKGPDARRYGYGYGYGYTSGYEPHHPAREASIVPTLARSVRLVRPVDPEPVASRAPSVARKARRPAPPAEPLGVAGADQPADVSGDINSGNGQARTTPRGVQTGRQSRR